jgi:hypothetical protein
MDETDALNPLAMASGMGLNLSPMYLLGGFIMGVVGLYYWRQGRKRQYPRTMWTGVVLMAYPLFVNNTILMWCLGIFLWAVAYYFKTEGQ